MVQVLEGICADEHVQLPTAEPLYRHCIRYVCMCVYIYIHRQTHTYTPIIIHVYRHTCKSLHTGYGLNRSSRVGGNHVRTHIRNTKIGTHTGMSLRNRLPLYIYTHNFLLIDSCIRLLIYLQRLRPSRSSCRSHIEGGGEGLSPAADSAFGGRCPAVFRGTSTVSLEIQYFRVSSHAIPVTSVKHGVDGHSGFLYVYACSPKIIEPRFAITGDHRAHMYTGCVYIYINYTCIYVYIYVCIHTHILR